MQTLFYHLHHTIHLVNSCVLGWSYEIVQFFFPHNFSKFPMELHILINEYLMRTPNLLNTLSKKCIYVFFHYCDPSMARTFHLEKYLIITETYGYVIIKFNGSSKFKLNQYLNPMINNGCR